MPFLSRHEKKRAAESQQTRHKFQIFSSVPICKIQHLRDPLGWQCQWEVRPNWCTQFETAKTSARDIQVENSWDWDMCDIQTATYLRRAKCKNRVDEVLTHSCISFVWDGQVFSCDCPFGLRAVPSEMVTILQITISSQPETKSLGHFLTSNFEPAQFHSSFEAAKTWVLRAPTRYVHKSKYGQLWPLSHISPSLHVDERPQKQETNTWEQLSFLCLNRLNTAYPWWLAKFKYSWQLVVPVSFL